MFPNHQRRERSRHDQRVASTQQLDANPHQQYSSPPQVYPQQHQQHFPSQYPVNSQNYPPQGYPHPQQGYPETQTTFDTSSHSNNSYNSQTYPPQHQHQEQYPPHHQQQENAPYPKWTPPNVQHPPLPHQDQYQYPPPPASELSGDSTPLNQVPPQSTIDPTPDAVAGQKDYEWKPPAALQAFQSTSDTTDQIGEGSEQTSVTQQDSVETPEIHDQEEDTSGFTDFLAWAKLEDPVDVSEILLNDPAIGTVTDIHGNSFLHGACDVGNISMVQFFLKNFSSDSATTLLSSNKQGFEPIHMAAFGGMMHIIGLLLKFDPSLAIRRTRSGSTMLHLAVANSNFQLVDFLLETLDDDTIWAVNNGGSNALHLACKFGNVAMIDRFAQLPGADVNFRNTVDDTTCTDLIIHNFDETMQVLVAGGAKLEATDATDLLGPKMKALYPTVKNPARVAATRSTDSYESSVNKSSPYSSKTLRKRQGGVSLVDNNDEVEAPPVASPSTDSATRRKSSSYFPPTNASFLPPKDSSSKDKVKEPLGKKDKSSKPKSKKISNPNSWIKSPSVDDEEIVKVSNAFSKDMSLSGETTELDSNQKPPEVDKKKEKEEDDRNDQDADTSQKMESDETEREPEPDADAELFQFVEACKIPELEAVLGVFPKILRDVNTIRNSVDGTSLLHSAASSGSLDVAQYLVEGVGADVNALDGNQQSPLHYAVEACQLILVRYLVKYCGAVLDFKDCNGKSALDLLPTDSSEDRDEIERIMQKSAKKAPSKRMKVTIPKFSSA